MNLGPSNLRGSHWQKKAKAAGGSGTHNLPKRSKGAPSAHKKSGADLVRELRERGTRCPYCLDGPRSSETWWRSVSELDKHLIEVHGFEVQELENVRKEQPKLYYKQLKKNGRKKRYVVRQQTVPDKHKFKNIELNCHYCTLGTVLETPRFSGVYQLQNHLMSEHGQFLKKAELLAVYEARRQARTSGCLTTAQWKGIGDETAEVPSSGSRVLQTTQKPNQLPK